MQFCINAWSRLSLPSSKGSTLLCWKQKFSEVDAGSKNLDMLCEQCTGDSSRCINGIYLVHAAVGTVSSGLVSFTFNILNFARFSNWSLGCSRGALFSPK